MRVAIFGASGFVGSTFVEQLLFKKSYEEVRVFIHSSGNAWRLARRELNLRLVDVLSRTEVRKALEGCTHVVNCTRGPDEVMLMGLRNLLQESRLQGIQRFIHLSSVAVYGDPPSPESKYEEAKPNPAPQSYGWVKAQQDLMVSQAHQRGLKSIILCPPNISGPYSPFVLGVLNDMRQGTLALLDEGKMVINLVDVENLCHAIELALTCEEADGRRIFVTDAEPITWKDFTEALMPIADRKDPLPSFPREEFLKLFRPEQRKDHISFLRTIKHLVSSDVRAALRKDPFLEKVDHSIRSLIGKLPVRVEDRLRYAIEGPISVRKVADSNPYSSRYNVQQLRGVYHTCERAKKSLGYEPRYTFTESMTRFCAWYQAMYGVGTESWKLTRELETI
ncbi:MAG: NAD(P)-dependent oxidoreductase [Candidatus Babeliaceae bacterium]|nr:NAD(P)-dependent oxidoreductase [Candidatus Babeliaceae bacterium]